nr:hypothetical protein CFP56_00169 [Quercus suber]
MVTMTSDHALVDLVNDHRQKWQRESTPAVFSLWPTVGPVPPPPAVQKQPTSPSIAHSALSLEDPTNQHHAPSAVAQLPLYAPNPSLMPLRGDRDLEASNHSRSMPGARVPDSPTVRSHVTIAASEENRRQGPGNMSFDLNRTDTPVAPSPQSSLGSAKPSMVWINRQAASSGKTLHGLGLELDPSARASPITPTSAKWEAVHPRPNLRVNVARANHDQPPPPPPKSPRHHAPSRTAPSPISPVSPVSPVHLEPTQRVRSPLASSTQQEHSYDVRFSPDFKSFRGSFDLEFPVLAQSVTRGVVKPVSIEHSSGRSPPNLSGNALDIAQTSLPPISDARVDSALSRPIAAVIPKADRSSPASIDSSRPNFLASPLLKLHHRTVDDGTLSSLSAHTEVKQTPASDGGTARAVGDQGQMPSATSMSRQTDDTDSASQSLPVRAPPPNNADLRSKPTATVPGELRSQPPSLPLKDDKSKADSESGLTKSFQSMQPASIPPVASFTLLPRDATNQPDLPLKRRPVNVNTQAPPAAPQTSTRTQDSSAVLNKPQSHQISATPRLDLSLKQTMPIQLLPAPSREAIREMRAQAQASSQPVPRAVRQPSRAPLPQSSSRTAPLPRTVVRRKSPNGLKPATPEPTSWRQESRPDSPPKVPTTLKSEPVSRGRRQSSLEGDQIANSNATVSSAEKQTQAPALVSEAPPRSRADSVNGRTLLTNFAATSEVSTSAPRLPPDGGISDMIARIQKLAQQSEALHTRYALLRSDRQKLSTSIISSLKENKPGLEDSNAMLDQHLSLNTISSSMDICFAKLKALDCRKEEAITSLVAHVEAQQQKHRVSATVPPPPATKIPQFTTEIPKQEGLIRAVVLPSSIITVPDSTMKIPKQKEPVSATVLPQSTFTIMDLSTETPKQKDSVNSGTSDPLTVIAPESSTVVQSAHVPTAQTQVLEKPAADVCQDALPRTSSHRDVEKPESVIKPTSANDLHASKDGKDDIQADTSSHLVRSSPPKLNDLDRNSTLRVTGQTAARVLSIIAQEATDIGTLETVAAGPDELEVGTPWILKNRLTLNLGAMMLEVDIPTSPFRLLDSSFWGSSPGAEKSEPHLLNKSDDSTGGSSETTLKRRTSLTSSSVHGSGSTTSSVVGSITDSSSFSRDEPEIGTPGNVRGDYVGSQSPTNGATPGAKSPGVLDDDLLDYYAQGRNGSVSTIISIT